MVREETPRQHAERVPTAILVVLALLVVRNLAGWVLLADWAYVPVNLALAAGLLALGWWAGLTRDEVGLDPRRARAGLAYGSAVLALVVGVVVTGALVPAVAPLFEDSRADVSAFGLLYHTTVRIPLGTVVLEEVAFRGLLLALLARTLSLRSAVLGSSVLFGLWHVLPSLGLGSRNDGLGDVDQVLGVAGVVAGAVIATTVVGMIFCWLRLRSGSLLAPVVAHVSTNSVAFLAAWIVMA